MGYITSGPDSGKVKVGDGSTPWMGLPYIKSGFPDDIIALSDQEGADALPDAGSIGELFQVVRNFLKWARPHADNSLAQAIADEAHARQQEDTALQNKINAEEWERRQADSDLAQVLTSNFLTRDTAIEQARRDTATVQNNINWIISAIEASYGPINGSSPLVTADGGDYLVTFDGGDLLVTAEAQEKQPEANSLAQAIADEAHARQQEDTALQNKINAEANNLQQEIHALRYYIGDLIKLVEFQFGPINGSFPLVTADGGDYLVTFDGGDLLVTA
jgi:hypothetical protein